ncbi:MAG: ribonuclease III [Microbacteriaceae bacterium]|nr:ribonuclease III [Microbacteriaceae bacterium]
MPTPEHPGSVRVPEALPERLGVPIVEPWLTRALTHRSFAYENGGIPTNERLEFLGDSVLGFVVSDMLMHRFPDIDEGELSRRRAALVSTQALARIANARDLGPWLRLGKGEQASGGQKKASLLADLVESLIAATYLSAGIDVVRDLVLRLVEPLVPDVAVLAAEMDPKTTLIELASRRGYGAPEYQIEAQGPDHHRVYRATAVCGPATGRGEGPSKKQAEMNAAMQAWRALGGHRELG